MVSLRQSSIEVLDHHKPFHACMQYYVHHYYNDTVKIVTPKKIYSNTAKRRICIRNYYDNGKIVFLACSLYIIHHSSYHLYNNSPLHALPQYPSTALILVSKLIKYILSVHDVHTSERPELYSKRSYRNT